MSPVKVTFTNEIEMLELQARLLEERAECAERREAQLKEMLKIYADAFHRAQEPAFFAKIEKFHQTDWKTAAAACVFQESVRLDFAVARITGTIARTDE